MTKQHRIAKHEAEAFGLISKLSALAIAGNGAIGSDTIETLKRLKVLKSRIERLEG